MKREYPDPSFERSEWIDLNGKWEFAFDDDDRGRKEGWQEKQLPLSINVPFVYQSEKSGIGDKTYHPVIWYAREIELEEIPAEREALLNFTAADHDATVYVNGNAVLFHRGGYTPFSVPVSDYLTFGKNRIAVRCEDRHDTAQCRGKQIWTESNFGCWYTASSGIWGDVWLSFTGKNRIEECMITPDLDNRMAHFEVCYTPAFSGKGTITVELLYNDEHVSTSVFETESYRQFLHVHVKQSHSVDDIHTWAPEHPNLYTALLTLRNREGNVLDEVKTYFGMRKISIHNGKILLNNRPLYQRLILDQGYWEDSLLTPPDDDAFRRDLELIKAMGFNGLRKHQKIESPKFYHLADKLGLIVWAELPSPYSFSSDEIIEVESEMSHIVRHLYNHPSIVTWVPFNESWGIRDVLHDRRQQEFVKGIFHIIKALDPIRLVSGNDGWEMPIHEFAAVHDYDIHDSESYWSKWGNLDELMKHAASHRQLLADCNTYNGEPVILTEYGGVALASQAHDGAWGYRGPAKDENELIERLQKLMDVIYSDARLAGFCYTQLTDVQQEVNGLLRPDRTPKCGTEIFKKIFSPREDR